MSSSSYLRTEVDLIVADMPAHLITPARVAKRAGIPTEVAEQLLADLA